MSEQAVDVKAPVEASTGTSDQGNIEARGISGELGESGITKEEAREAIRKFKVKVDGQELEVDEAELLKGYGHQRAASKRMQEAIKMRKQAEEFIGLLKDKNALFQVIQKLGHDPRQLSEEYLGSIVEDELLDPKEREFRKTKAELQRLKELDKMREEQATEARMSMLKKKYSEDYNKQFQEALEKVKLPVKKHTVQEMAKYIYKASKLGYQMSAMEAAKLVEEDVKDAQRSIVGDADAETLMKLFGDDLVNKIRKWDTSRLKNPATEMKSLKTTEAKLSQPRSSSGKRLTAREWRDFNRN